MTDPREIALDEQNFRVAILLLLERIAVALETRKSEPEDFGDHAAGHDPDYLAAVAAEAEARIQGGSTPNVARDVDVQEVEDEYVVEEGIHINLLEQPRESLDALEVLAPGDKYILLARERNDPVYIAALEIVYSNTARDFWGTDSAGRQIDTLMGMHRG